GGCAAITATGCEASDHGGHQRTRSRYRSSGGVASAETARSPTTPSMPRAVQGTVHDTLTVTTPSVPGAVRNPDGSTRTLGAIQVMRSPWRAVCAATVALRCASAWVRASEAVRAASYAAWVTR